MAIRMLATAFATTGVLVLGIAAVQAGCGSSDNPGPSGTSGGTGSGVTAGTGASGTSGVTAGTNGSAGTGGTGSTGSGTSGSGTASGASGSSTASGASGSGTAGGMSGSGTAGGASGSGTAGGASGTGGSTGSGSGGSAGSGTSGSSGAGAGSSLILVAAVSASSMGQSSLGFAYNESTDAWSAGATIGDAHNGGIDGQNGAVAVAFDSANHAIAVITNATDTTGVSGPLQTATWDSGKWTAFASIGSFDALGPPSLTISGGAPWIAFAANPSQAESTLSYANAKWSAATLVGSYSGGPPSYAARGSDASVAYVRKKDSALVAVDRTNGVWGTEQVIQTGSGALAPTTAFAPTLVALSGSSADLLVIYTDTGATDIHSATRTGGHWSAIQALNLPTKVINSDLMTPTDGPSMAYATPALALAGGKAAIAFTSVSQHVYTSQFDGTKWSTATSVFTPWCLDCLDAAQVGFAAGIGSATMEIVFGGDPNSQNAYVPYHTRLVSGVWTKPKPVLASSPGLFAAYALASH